VAIRSVIEIDVVDDAFNAFKSKFDEYTKQIKNVADAEKKANVEKMGFLERQVYFMKTLVGLQERANLINDSANRDYDTMEKRTAKIATNLASGTASLLRWASSATTFGVLAGGLGLFGLDRLAEGVGSARKSAMGLGASYGGQKSFMTHYSPILHNSEGVLQAAANAKRGDPETAGALGRLGITPDQIRRSSSDELAVLIAEGGRRLALTENGSNDSTMINRYGLGSTGLSVEDFSMRNLSAEEMARRNRDYHSDQPRFDQDAKTQGAWSDFAEKLHAAGEQIEQTFVSILSPLAPNLTKLSGAFVELMSSVLKGPALGKWIDDISKDLGKLGTEIGKESFKKGVLEFTDSIIAFAHDLKDLLPPFHTFVEIIKGIADPGGTVDKAMGLNPEDAANQRSKNADFIKRMFKGEDTPDEKAANAKGNHLLRVIGNLEDRTHVMDGVERDVWAGKGANRHLTQVVGHYQITKDTALSNGFDPERLKDKAYNAHVAASLLAKYEKEFKGDVAEVLVAYNGGEGAAKAFHKNNHDITKLNPETQQYLINAIKQNPTVNIRVTTPPGYNPNVSAASATPGTTAAVK